MRKSSLLSLLLLTAATSSGLWACKTNEPPATEVIVSYGHGAFIGARGRVIQPDLALVRRTQEDFIKTLRHQAGKAGAPAVDDTRKLIASKVDDEVVANALFIDWLNEIVQPSDRAQIETINGALRSYYLEHLQPSKLSPQEQRETKGVGSKAALSLAMNGIKAFSQTTSGGEEYIRECEAAGVPIPPPMYSSGWVNRGVVDDEFISTPERAELLYYESEKPPGVCLALPRYLAGTDTAVLLGVICLGTVSNKACFWDYPSGKTLTKGVEVDISKFVGGYDLQANAQGICSDCHAGENPFIVHPEKPPFVGLSLFGTSWYEPIVHPSWPQNPGPSALLDAVASPGRCDSCHRAGGTGRRFPALSQALPGYCNVVFETAVSAPLPGTMPPYGMDPALFTAHVDALRAACKTPSTTGTNVPVELPDDEGKISPPIVIDPLYACATEVAVRGAILDAKVTLFINGTDVGSLIARSPQQEVFTVPALNPGDEVTAQQEVGGAVSALSPIVKVRDYKEDYPKGLPAPVIDPSLIYECAEIIAVRHVPGARLTVIVNGGAPASRSTSTGWSAIWPGKRPFAIGDEFRAQIELCGEVSPESAPEKAVAAPKSMPAPSFNPPQIFEGQELVSLESLTNGARTELEVAGVGSAGGFTTPISWFPDHDVATPLGRPLSAGDVLVAQQKLCDAGPPNQTPPAGKCDELPAPKIHQPIPGTSYVVVWQSIPGARIRVYDSSGKELGDGSGTVILLNRSLTNGDVLTVVQQVGKCTSKAGYQVRVSGDAQK